MSAGQPISPLLRETILHLAFTANAPTRSRRLTTKALEAMRKHGYTAAQIAAAYGITVAAVDRQASLRLAPSKHHQQATRAERMVELTALLKRLRSSRLT